VLPSVHPSFKKEKGCDIIQLFSTVAPQGGKSHKYPLVS